MATDYAPPPGRTSMRTPARVALILSALRAGNTHKAAAAYGGVSHQTFYNWMRDGTPLPGLTGDDEGLTFIEVVTRAEAQAEAAMVARVMQAAVLNWQAAAWWLERRRHNDFGIKRYEISGPDGGPVVLQQITESLDDHERAALRRVIDGVLAETVA